jgi:hypothetical protein
MLAKTTLEQAPLKGLLYANANNRNIICKNVMHAEFAKICAAIRIVLPARGVPQTAIRFLLLPKIPHTPCAK